MKLKKLIIFVTLICGDCWPPFGRRNEDHLPNKESSFTIEINGEGDEASFDEFSSNDGIGSPIGSSSPKRGLTFSNSPEKKRRRGYGSFYGNDEGAGVSKKLNFKGDEVEDSNGNDSEIDLD